MLLVLLFVLVTPQYPSCLALLKTAIYISFDPKNPTASTIVAMRDLAKIDKIEHIVLSPDLVFVSSLLQAGEHTGVRRLRRFKFVLG